LCRLNKLYITSHSNNLDFCSVYRLGKAKQLPFSKPSRQSLVSLALIRYDIWVSLLNQLVDVSTIFYLLMIIPVIHGYIILEQKSDVFATFVKFKTIAEKLFSTSIK
jgi:hypothetical protein